MVPLTNAKSKLRKEIDAVWETLTSVGLSSGASRDRLTFTPSMKEAESNADFIQESGPERQDFKIKIFAEVDDLSPSDSIIASS